MLQPPNPLKDQLQIRLSAVRERISAACQRSGRSPDSVQLLPTTKYAPLPVVETLLSLNVTTIAESRPQQLIERAQRCSTNIHWHLIGHLQRNKVRAVMPYVTMIHSVDSLRLLETLREESLRRQQSISVLLEVNISGEDSKDGFKPDELIKLWPDFDVDGHVKIDGLMTMAPLTDDPELARPVFRRLKQLLDDRNAQLPPHRQMQHLSMGMSDDFEIAIEEGATIIRLGSCLFDGLDRPLE